MNDAVHIASLNAGVVDSRVAQMIADETGTPIDLAARVYREEFRALAHEARITQFVSLIASRRARLRLRRRS